MAVLIGVVAVVLVAADDTAGSVVDVVLLSVMYAGLFAAGAWLFSRVPEPPVDAVASDIRRA